MTDLETGIGIGRQLQAIENRVMMQDKMIETLSKDVEALSKDLEEIIAQLKDKNILVEK